MMKGLILMLSLIVLAPTSAMLGAGTDQEFVARSMPTRDVSSSPSSNASNPSANDSQRSDMLVGRTLFRVDPRFGDIAVETIFGRVNGAQLRMTW